MSQTTDTARDALRLRIGSRQANRVWLFGAVTVGFIALMAISSVVGFMFSDRRDTDIRAFQSDTRDIASLRVSLIDAETGVRGFLVSGRVDYLEPYFGGMGRLDNLNPSVLTSLDAASATATDPRPVTRRVDALRQIWKDAVTLIADHAPVAATDLLLDRHQKQVMDELREVIGTVLAERRRAVTKANERLGLQRDGLLGIHLTGAIIAIVGLIYSFRLSIRETRRREAVMAESGEATHRVELLFSMTNMLQSATDRKDANEVLCATAARLLPGFNGVFYIFNNSQDRLDVSASWGEHAGGRPLEHIQPESCWAMKRGKPHLNVVEPGALRCGHYSHDTSATLEIPMAARGQIFGLLLICRGDGHLGPSLQEIQPIAAALADSMSLALSSMALRELLRNQALRDPLTGLYNRRFLDEMLAHLTLDARRRKTPLSAIMVDLDNFKQLNDQYGHSTGDAVLREVSSTIVRALRASDIACRYGGEELAVLLPDCPLDMAMFKAEQLRAQIAEVSAGSAGAIVTASLGVAALPETSITPAGLLEDADAALYQAKLKGRNRVAQAPRMEAPPGEFTATSLRLTNAELTAREGR